MQIFLHFFTIRNKIPRLFTAYNHADSVYTDIRGAQAVNNQSDGRSGRTKMQKQAYVLRDANVPSEGTHT